MLCYVIQLIKIPLEQLEDDQSQSREDGLASESTYSHSELHALFSVYALDHTYDTHIVNNYIV